jgi:ABC-type iron transport system FetAB permease component
MAARVGAALTSLTVTVKEREMEVTPSETATVTSLVLGPWASVGVQVRTPAEVTDMPVGPEVRENVSVWAGRSVSVPERVTLRTCPSSTVWLEMAARIGDALTSLTVTVKEREVEVTPSETVTVTSLVLGPWASEGVQVRTPAEVTDMPVGPEVRENVRV